jgi:phosphoribosylaminoimidazolecarboxamide formyltransferase/IMP cyclohydrolase
MQSIDLRYGANPHQQQARISSVADLPFRVASGTPGYINFLDALNSWQLVHELAAATGLPAATSFKHVSPAGAALGLPLSEQERAVFRVGKGEVSPLASAYARARGADRMSSFGDWIALSEPLDVATAELIRPEVSDGLIAPGADAAALKIVGRKQGGAYKVLLVDADYEPPVVECREVFGLSLQQERNALQIGPDLLTEIPTRNHALTADARRDMLVAMVVLKYTQSNSVCVVAGGQAIGIGCGQQSRIHCVQLAVEKARAWAFRFAPELQRVRFKPGLKRHDKDTWTTQFVGGVRTTDDAWMNAQVESMPQPLAAQQEQACLAQLPATVLASDGFFPHRDSIDAAAAARVSHVVQPGGSVQDAAIVAACDERDMVMVMTGLRLFHH